MHEVETENSSREYLCECQEISNFLIRTAPGIFTTSLFIPYRVDARQMGNVREQSPRPLYDNLSGEFAFHFGLDGERCPQGSWAR